MFLLPILGHVQNMDVQILKMCGTKFKNAPIREHKLPMCGLAKNNVQVERMFSMWAMLPHFKLQGNTHKDHIYYS